MPEYLRSLIVVLVISTAVFYSFDRSFSPLMAPGAFQRRRNAFLALTVCGFLAPGFWFYAVPASALILFAARREQTLPALFVALLFVVPPAAEQVPGMGMVNFLLYVDHPRLLALLVLLPAATTLLRNPAAGKLLLPDRFLLAYILLQAGLILSRAESFTNGLRGVVYLLIDVLLPYYVMSRIFFKMDQLKDALAAMCMSGVLLAAVACFETAKHWLVYRSLLDHWGAQFGMGNYIMRDGMIRASATTGQPIVLGLVLFIALACFMALRQQMRPGLKRSLVWMILLAGLAATYSRGPWLGALTAIFVFWATFNRSRMRIGLGIGVALATALLLDAQIPFLSMVRGIDQGTAQYRTELFTKSMEVFAEHPWLGSDQYVQRLAAKGMVQGEGIVDLVNTYLGVALASGAIGLSLFVAVFASTLRGLWKSRPGVRSLNPELSAKAPPAGDRAPPVEAQATVDASLLARGLIASLAGVLVTLATVSSVSVIPWACWVLAGTAVGYMRMALVQRASTRAIPRPSPGSAPLNNRVSDF
jgi:O-antigen ligase